MLKRLIVLLVLAQVLVLVVATTDVMDTVHGYLGDDAPPGPTVSGAEKTTEPAVEPTPTTEPTGDPVTGISSRSTADHVWAEPTIDGGNVIIPLAVTKMSDHFHFEVPGSSGALRFVGYWVSQQLHIRASVCPECGGKNVDYHADGLRCSGCSARFDLQLGSSLSGGKGYPQGSIPVALSDDSVTSLLHSLTVAYERTAAGKETLYEGPAVPFPVGCSNC